MQIFPPYAVERRIISGGSYGFNTEALERLLKDTFPPWTAHLAVHIPDIRTAESTYNQYGQCLAGCNGLYVRSRHPCALHCARFTMAAPIRAYQRAGQTREVKMSLRSRESVSKTCVHFGLLALLPRGLSIMKTHKHSTSQIDTLCCLMGSLSGLSSHRLLTAAGVLVDN